jgi:hypothetical protein
MRVLHAKEELMSANLVLFVKRCCSSKFWQLSFEANCLYDGQILVFPQTDTQFETKVQKNS